MSNKIVFRTLTDSKKKGPAQQRSKQQQQQQQAPQPQAGKSAAAAAPAAPPAVNQEEQERKRKLEEERKAALQKKIEDFNEAKSRELDEEGERKALALDQLFELRTLAQTPAYCAIIMNNRTMRYEEVAKVPEVAKFCDSWTDVVALVKRCKNLRYIQDDYDCVLLNHDETRLFSCIAKVACKLQGLPEKMSAGDLRMILGPYPLSISKKPNATAAQVLFRDGIVRVSMFFKSKTLTTKKMVDGELKVVSEPFSLGTIILKDEDKRPYYDPESVRRGADEARTGDSSGEVPE